MVARGQGGRRLAARTPRHPPSDADDDREQLGNEIAGLMGPLVRSLSDAQAVYLLGTAGALTTKDLAGRLAIDPANASTLVTRLERRGLVQRDL